MIFTMAFEALRTGTRWSVTPGCGEVARSASTEKMASVSCTGTNGLLVDTCIADVTDGPAKCEEVPMAA
jgi:hypothetical protein